MNKYIVNVNINKVDKDGNLKTEDFKYEFDNIIGLYDARIKAINKAKVLVSFFENEMPEESKFSSFSEAERNGFKNYQSYSLIIDLIDENGESPIFGCDYTEQIDWLEYETQVFKEEPYNVECIEIENLSGEKVSILKNENEFLLAWYWNMKS